MEYDDEFSHLNSEISTNEKRFKSAYGVAEEKLRQKSWNMSSTLVDAPLNEMSMSVLLGQYINLLVGRKRMYFRDEWLALFKARIQELVIIKLN